MNTIRHTLLKHFMLSLFILVVVLASCITEPDGAPNFGTLKIHIPVYVEGHVSGPRPTDTTRIVDINYKSQIYPYKCRYQVSEVNDSGFYNVTVTLLEKQ